MAPKVFAAVRPRRLLALRLPQGGLHVRGQLGRGAPDQRVQLLDEFLAHEALLGEDTCDAPGDSRSAGSGAANAAPRGRRPGRLRPAAWRRHSRPAPDRAPALAPRAGPRASARPRARPRSSARPRRRTARQPWYPRPEPRTRPASGLGGSAGPARLLDGDRRRGFQSCHEFGRHRPPGPAPDRKEDDVHVPHLPQPMVVVLAPEQREECGGAHHLIRYLTHSVSTRCRHPAAGFSFSRPDRRAIEATSSARTPREEDHDEPDQDPPGRTRHAAPVVQHPGRPAEAAAARRCTPAPSSRSAPTTWRRSSRWG